MLKISNTLSVLSTSFTSIHLEMNIWVSSILWYCSSRHFTMNPFVLYSMVVTDYNYKTRAEDSGKLKYKEDYDLTDGGLKDPATSVQLKTLEQRKFVYP